MGRQNFNLHHRISGIFSTRIGQNHFKRPTNENVLTLLFPTSLTNQAYRVGQTCPTFYFALYSQQQGQLMCYFRLNYQLIWIAKMQVSGLSS